MSVLAEFVQKSAKEADEGELGWSRQIGEVEEPDGDLSDERDVESEGE